MDGTVYNSFVKISFGLYLIAQPNDYTVDFMIRLQTCIFLTAFMLRSCNVNYPRLLFVYPLIVTLFIYKNCYEN